MQKKPVVCVLLGDASGVGPEIIVKAFGGDQKATEKTSVVLLGDVRTLVRAEELIGKKSELYTGKTGRNPFVRP